MYDEIRIFHEGLYSLINLPWELLDAIPRERIIEETMKKNVIFIMAVFFTILYVRLGALAELLFDMDYFQSAGLLEEGIETAHSIIVTDEHIYAYLEDETIRIVNDDRTLRKYCSLPTITLNPYLIPVAEDYDNVVTNISTDGDDLYGWNIYSGQFGRISEKGIEWEEYILQINCLHPFDDLYTYRISKSFIKNDILFVLASKTGFQEESKMLFSFSIRNGVSRLIENSEIASACAGVDDTIILLCKDDGKWVIQISSVDYLDHPYKTIELLNFDQNDVVYGLAYDESNNTILFACNSYLYFINENGEIACVGPILVENSMIDSEAWVLNDTYILSGSGGITLYDISREKDKKTKIVVRGENLQKINTAFQKTNSECQVAYEAKPISSIEVEQAIRRKDTSVDIYCIPADYIFTSIKDSSFESLTDKNDYYNDVPEKILSVISNKKGEIVAFPSSIQFQLFRVNHEYWSMVFGDKALPQTIEELVDDWFLYETYYTDQYPLLDFWFGFDKSLLIKQFTLFYLQTHSIEQDPSFCSLRYVVNKLNNIEEVRKEKNKVLHEWTPEDEEGHATIFSLFYTRESMSMNNNLFIESIENTVYGICIFNYTDIEIAWSDSSNNETNAILYVLVINPFSCNKEKALKYIDCASEVTTNPYLFYSIHTDVNRPYENYRYSYIQQAIQKDKAYLEEALAQDGLSLSERHDIESALIYEQIMLDENIKKWIITSETITHDRKMLEMLNLHDNNSNLPNQQLSEEIISLCDEYAYNGLSIDCFFECMTKILQH